MTGKQWTDVSDLKIEELSEDSLDGIYTDLYSKILVWKMVSDDRVFIVGLPGKDEFDFDSQTVSEYEGRMTRYQGPVKLQIGQAVTYDGRAASRGALTAENGRLMLFASGDQRSARGRRLNVGAYQGQHMSDTIMFPHWRLILTTDSAEEDEVVFYEHRLEL